MTVPEPPSTSRHDEPKYHNISDFFAVNGCANPQMSRELLLVNKN
jgi:hypothetical protein